MRGVTISLILLVVVVLTPFTAAADPAFIFREFDDIDLKISCIDENQTWCSANTPCQININYPNSSNLVKNGSMTFNEQFYNFSLNHTETSPVGEYASTVSCQGTAEDGFATFTYEITKTGTKPTTAQGILYFVAVMVCGFLFALSLMGAIKIPWKNNRDEFGSVVGLNDLKYAKLALWFMSYTLLIIITFLMWNITHGFFAFDLAARIFKWMFFTLMALFIPMIAIMFITMIVRIIRDKKINEALTRGVPFRF